MTESSRFRPILRLALLSLLLSPLVGCVSPGGIKDGGEISKVKYQRLNIKDRAQARAADPMLRNERSRRTHGAITPLETRARQGYYYSVFWRTDDPFTPATVKFEYRQGKVVDEILVKEVEVDPAGEEAHITDFEVIGEEFREDGDVLAFRFSVEQNGQVIADHKSYLWE